MNNKLFLGFLIGFVILLVIFIIILLTTEDNNNLIKSIGSSILILFGGSLTGYLTYSKNNKCKCGSYEKYKCGSYEIKGSGPFDWISEKLFGKKNNTQKEVENLNQMLKTISNNLDSINNEYIFLENENLNNIMQSKFNIKQQYFDKINEIENNANKYNFQNILYLQLIFNSMGINEQNLYKDKIDKHLNKLTQEDKKRLEENINMFKNDINIDIINPKNRKKIKNKEYLKLLDKAEKELQNYKDLELAKNTPLPDDKMLVRVKIPKKNKKIVINMINKLKNDFPLVEKNIPMLEENIPMLEENNLKIKMVDSISKYEVRTPTEWKNIKFILKHDSDIKQLITPEISKILDKIIDDISELEEKNILSDNKENNILELAKNTPLPDDEENLIYDIPISDNILNSSLTNEMIEISEECEKNLNNLINLVNINQNNFKNIDIIAEINQFINDAPEFINKIKNTRQISYLDIDNLYDINKYIEEYIIELNNILKKNNLNYQNIQLKENNKRVGFRPVSSQDFHNNARKNKNQYIDNTLKTIQEIKELVQVQENLQNVQETVESLINRNEQLNNDKINIFTTEILPEFEKNLQTLNSLVKINKNKLKNIDELNNYIEEMFQWKETNDINNDTVDVIDYFIIKTNNHILDKINEVNNILKENNNLKTQDVQLQQENKEKIKQTNNLNNLEKASNIVLSMNKNIESEALDIDIKTIEQNIKELYYIIISYREKIINNNNINKESYDLFKETMYKFDDIKTVSKIKKKYTVIQNSMNDIKNKITKINNKNYNKILSDIENYNNKITEMYTNIINLQDLFNNIIVIINKEKIEQTNIVQKDNLQKIKEIEKEEIENKLIIANTLKDLISQIEINKDLTDDNINKISEMITNIEIEQTTMANEEKDMREFIRKREDEKFDTNWNMFDYDDDGVTPIAEKANLYWRPSVTKISREAKSDLIDDNIEKENTNIIISRDNNIIKKIPNILNTINNNIENKINKNKTKITLDINNIITYNCNSITNLFNTIKNKTISVANDAKLKMIKEIYNNINSNEMNTKDCKFIEDNLTEINNLIDFYNKNKKDDKLNKISIKDGKINIDSTSNSTDISSTPAFESPTPTPSSTASKASTPGSSTSTPASKTTTPTSTTPVKIATPSSSLGSSLPTNLSGLPIIAPALKYKESEKKDTSFDKYLAKLLSSSI